MWSWTSVTRTSSSAARVNATCAQPPAFLRVLQLALVLQFVTLTHSYSLQALNTPIIIDIKEPPVHVQQCEKFFILVDASGINVYNHDGRPLPQPKIAAMRSDILNSPCARHTSHLTPHTGQIFSTSALSAWQTTSYALWTTPIPRAADCAPQLLLLLLLLLLLTSHAPEFDDVCMYDAATGKLQELVIKHTQEISKLCLNSGGGSRR